jgi:hypothetical protein
MLRKGILIGILALTANAFAQDGGTSMMSRDSIEAGNRVDQIGLGVQVGSLSGVNMEYWTSKDTTINAGLTFSQANTALSLAHVWMFPGAFSGSAAALVPYVGAGALGIWGNTNSSDNRNYNNDNFIFAAQVPVGLEFLPAAQRFSIYGELVPSLEIAPYVVGFLNADIGARFYF